MLPTPKQQQARADNNVRRSLAALVKAVNLARDFPPAMLERLHDLEEDFVDEIEIRTERRRQYE